MQPRALRPLLLVWWVLPSDQLTDWWEQDPAWNTAIVTFSVKYSSQWTEQKYLKSNPQQSYTNLQLVTSGNAVARTYLKLKQQRTNYLIFISLLLYLINYYLYLKQMKILLLDTPELNEGMSQSISDQGKAFHSTFIFTGRLLWPVWSRSPSKVTPCLDYRLACKKNISSQFHRRYSQLLIQIHEMDLDKYFNF